MRKVRFINGGYYHIYNRGVDKRKIYLDDKDYMRFLVSMRKFNRIDPIGNLYQWEYSEKSGSRKLDS